MTEYTNFTSNAPVLEEYNPPEREWILVKEMVVIFNDQKDDQEIVVPEGFITDLASVPRVGRWFVSVVGLWNRAAITHDYLYELPLNNDDINTLGYTRKEADNIFLSFMKDLGVNWFTRNTMWLATRIGGGLLWGKDN